MHPGAVGSRAGLAVAFSLLALLEIVDIPTASAGW
jgi:hypothetical protein